MTSINPELILTNIERAGRVCYQSENNLTKSSTDKFVEMLIASGHESVIEHESISVKFICDRGVSHELVRHRLASFSQESTRFCNYNKDKFDNQITFIIPNWISDEQIELAQRVNERNFMNVDKGTYEWYISMNEAEHHYLHLINFIGWTPQQARSVLPNSLKTEIVVTANLREWRTIFKQRTVKAAHSQMRELMCPLLDELKKKLYVIFKDIQYDS